MIDREKVINELVSHIENALSVDSDYVDCIPTDLLQYAVALLKADQTYLQKLTERLQLIADIAYDYDGYRTSKQLMELIDEMRDIAIRGLPEVKDD